MGTFPTIADGGRGGGLMWPRSHKAPTLIIQTARCKESLSAYVDMHGPRAPSTAIVGNVRPKRVTNEEFTKKWPFRLLFMVYIRENVICNQWFHNYLQPA